MSNLITLFFIFVVFSKFRTVAKSLSQKLNKQYSKHLFPPPVNKYNSLRRSFQKVLPTAELLMSFGPWIMFMSFLSVSPNGSFAPLSQGSLCSCFLLYQHTILLLVFPKLRGYNYMYVVRPGSKFISGWRKTLTEE